MFADSGGKFRIPSIIDYALQASTAEEPHCSYLAPSKAPFLPTPKSLSMLGYTSENLYDHDICKFVTKKYINIFIYLQS